MADKLKSSNTPDRTYPKLAEKIIPVALGLVIVLLLVLLIITFGVALGAWGNPPQL